MSYINVVTLSKDSVEQLGLKGMVDSSECDSIYIADLADSSSYRDGEELAAAADLLARLRELDNGELLVVAVDYF